MVTKSKLENLLLRIGVLTGIPTSPHGNEGGWLTLDYHNGYKLILKDIKTGSEQVAFDDSYERKDAKEMHNYMSGIIVGLKAAKESYLIKSIEALNHRYLKALEKITSADKFPNMDSNAKGFVAIAKEAIHK